jgi:hypothetical protein
MRYNHILAIFFFNAPSLGAVTVYTTIACTLPALLSGRWQAVVSWPVSSLRSETGRYPSSEEKKIYT